MSFGSSLNNLISVTPEWSVEASYPSVSWDNSLPPVKKEIIYEFTFADGNMTVSYGMMTRLCQEGHTLKLLLFGGNGFKRENDNVFQTLQFYGISKEAFQALVFSLRTNNPVVAYKYKLMYESIGGFKFLDKYHMKRVKKKKEKSDLSSHNLHTNLDLNHAPN